MANRKNTEGKEKGLRKKLDRLLLGVVIGGAVGSILGVTLAPKSGKETRQQMRDRSRETWERISAVIDEKTENRGKTRKKSIWHALNRIFIRNHRDDDTA